MNITSYSCIGLRGTEGPIIVSEPNPMPEITDAFLKSAEKIGYPNRDINGESQIGKDAVYLWRDNILLDPSYCRRPYTGSKCLLFYNQYS